MANDKKILPLLHERSEQAIPALSGKYGRLCLSIARSVLGSEQDAQECVADTFLAVWNQIPPDNPTSLGAYISRIVRNLSLTRRSHNTAAMRDQRLNVCLEELEAILPGGEDPAKTMESRLITETIDRYLSTQNKTNRAIFVRRYYLHQSCKQIGAYFGMTEQAVRSRLLRLREGLRAALEKEGITV